MLYKWLLSHAVLFILAVGGTLPIVSCTAVEESDEYLAQASGTNCVIVRFSNGSGTPVSYEEAGVKVTSLYPSSPHLHFEYGPLLYNHDDCCSTPYEFRLTLNAPFGPRFRVFQATFKDLSGTHFFSTSRAGRVPFVPRNGVISFPQEFNDIESFRWHVETGSGKLDDLVICPAVAPEDTILGIPRVQFDEEFSQISCANPDTFTTESTARALELYRGYFRLPETTNELFETSPPTITREWVRKY